LEGEDVGVVELRGTTDFATIDAVAEEEGAVGGDGVLREAARTPRGVGGAARALVVDERGNAVVGEGLGEVAERRDNEGCKAVADASRGGGRRCGEGEGDDAGFAAVGWAGAGDEDCGWVGARK
jgi:hypothetical protein